ncbi:MAG TPA: family 78 glycoside hydrolase catalytic domain [Candidatus Dormibacteraeota bacterium]
MVSREQHAVHGGRPLRSREHCEWTVQVWAGEAAEPGPPAAASFEVGLLRRSDWRARWIADPARLGGRSYRRPSLLRRSFELPAVPRRARLYASARGLYRLEINGRRVGEDLFRPGWTDYRRRLQYQTYDVGALLQQGVNEIVAELADGWYSGKVAWAERWYGDHPSLLLQLEADLDAARFELLSGPDWEATWGPITSTDMLLGESHDAGASPGRPRRAAVDSAPHAALVPDAAPVRRVIEVAPIAESDGVYDFGQNLVGRVRLAVGGASGSRVRLRHAEMLDADGRLYTDNLRGAACTDEFVLGGERATTWEPEFTFRGFRYAEVTGDAEVNEATAVVVQSDLPEALEFECSHELVNRLHANIVWSQRGNFVDVPTDCPQRDERLGWLGDAQVFAATACMNMDCAEFLGEKWLRSLADGQRKDGAFMDVAPVMVRQGRRARVRSSAPGWADAGVIVPSVLYDHYADARQLARAYPSMKRHVDFVRAHNPDLLWTEARGYDFGDWLAIEEETPKEVVATAYFARSASLLARAASALGRAADASAAAALASGIRRAFGGAYISADGRVHGDTQTAYVLALAFDLVPEALRAAAAGHLVRRIEAAGGHLRTGFLGVGHLLPVLDATGHVDLAQRLLVDTGFPSWGYSIERGATTVWERWDGWTEEKGFQDPKMNSFNHYSLGSVGAWIYATVGGLAPDPDRPGWERAIVRPRPNPALGLSWGRTRHHSVRGPFACSWRIEDGKFAMEVEVPPNAGALVYVPGAERAVEVGSGLWTF